MNKIGRISLRTLSHIALIIKAFQFPNLNLFIGNSNVISNKFYKNEALICNLVFIMNAIFNVVIITTTNYCRVFLSLFSLLSYQMTSFLCTRGGSVRRELNNVL